MTPREWPDQNWMRAQDLAGSFTDDKLLNVGRIAAELAAVEERGRRAGIGAHVRDLHAIENALSEFETDPPTALRVVGEHVGMALHNLRALAPRDSGKETVPVLYPARDGTCMYCHERHPGVCGAMNGQEDRK